MKCKGLVAAMIGAAALWLACFILSAVFFGFKAAALLVIGGLAVGVGVKVDHMMEEAGDDE